MSSTSDAGKTAEDHDADEHDSRPVRVCTRKNEEVLWPRNAARLSNTLSDWMDDCSDDVAYPVSHDITATELSLLRDLCIPDLDSSMALAEKSATELFRLIEGANFLAATPALKYAQKDLASRFAGKKAEGLTQLLGVIDDRTADVRAAALAEPLFTPAGGGAQAGTANAQPAVVHQQSLSESIKDARVLCEIDVITLTELKGVHSSWCTLARNELCLRLCCREDQLQPPQQPSEITDLDVSILAGASRLWEAALAGRILPNLARLHGHGLEVNVAAVRAAHLPEVPTDEEDEDEDDEDDEDDGRNFGSAALLGCITGEGKPPLELKLAAVACAASGVVWGVPVELLRMDEVRELNLDRKRLGNVGAQLLGSLLPGATSLVDLR